MADFLRRLARMEAAADSAKRDCIRAARIGLAQKFLEDGDPREDEAFSELAPNIQRRWAWLYDAWKLTPSGFVKGVLPPELAPEPEPYVLFTRPPAEPDPWARPEWTGTDD